MGEISQYEAFLRQRITELRLKKDVSEHRMSLELGRSGAYIRGITSGAALPSVRELFNICAYFDITPAEFFRGIEGPPSARGKLQQELAALSDADLEKVALFLDWIR